MMRSYATLLTTDDYLPGTLVLYHSLVATSPDHPFVVLVTEAVSPATLSALSAHGIAFETIAPWPIAPLMTESDDPETVERRSRSRFNYTKLQVFGLTQYSKLVFLDSDLLIVGNIDELFDRPHLSAVNAGGLLPELRHWTRLNSGLMVIEPSHDLHARFLEFFPAVRFAFGGDQEFIYGFYPDWPQRTELHLDHGFNIFDTHLDRYHELAGYELGHGPKPVKVVHFADPRKPWQRLEPPDEPSARRKPRLHAARRAVASVMRPNERAHGDRAAKALDIWCGLHESHVRDPSLHRPRVPRLP